VSVLKPVSVCVCVCARLINSGQIQNRPLEGEDRERSNNISTEEIDGWSVAKVSLDSLASNNSIHSPTVQREQTLDFSLLLAFLLR